MKARVTISLSLLICAVLFYKLFYIQEKSVKKVHIKETEIRGSKVIKVADFAFVSKPVGSILFDLINGSKNLTLLMLGGGHLCDDNPMYKTNQIGKDTIIIDSFKYIIGHKTIAQKNLQGKYINLLEIIQTEMNADQDLTQKCIGIGDKGSDSEKLDKISRKKEISKELSFKKIDKHIWVSPKMMKVAISKILNLLEDEDSNMINSKNVKKVMQKLESINYNSNKSVVGCNKVMFDMDGSISNFALSYSVNYHGSILDSTKTPDHMVLTKLKEAIKNGQDVCIVGDKLHYYEIGSRIERSLQNEGLNSAKVLLLDLDGNDIEIDEGIDGYEAFMNNIINSIQRCVC